MWDQCVRFRVCKEVCVLRLTTLRQFKGLSSGALKS